MLGGTGDLQEVLPRLTWEGAGPLLGSGWHRVARSAPHPVVLFFREPCGPFFHFLWKDTEAALNLDVGSLSGRLRWSAFLNLSHVSVFALGPVPFPSFGMSPLGSKRLLSPRSFVCPEAAGHHVSVAPAFAATARDPC